ncbi:MAG: hypothetical protein KDD62_01875 [Bdellovibrionales bacterium]|nr:hypothetical protein [Bdellovibrionales bacterium]
MHVHTSAYLKKCESLAREASLFAPRVGSVVARGFADLGCEEFLVLPNEGLLSLYSGQVNKSMALGDPQLFVVPDIQQMQEALRELQFDLETLNFVDQRFWELRLKPAHGNELVTCQHERLEEVFLDALIVVTSAKED